MLKNNSNQEIELKFEISEKNYKTLLKEYHSDKVEIQDNWFFDTNEKILRKNYWAFRIRFEGSQVYLTAKGPRNSAKDVSIRQEYEIEISSSEGSRLQQGFWLSAEYYSPVKLLYRKFGDLLVQPLLHFKNERNYIPWQEWCFELDKTQIGKSIFYELEIETHIDHLNKLKEQVEILFSRYGWPMKYSETDKFTKALNLLT